MRPVNLILEKVPHGKAECAPRALPEFASSRSSEKGGEAASKSAPSFCQSLVIAMTLCPTADAQSTIVRAMLYLPNPS